MSRKKRSRKPLQHETEEVDDGVKQTLGLHPLFVKINVNTKGKMKCCLLRVM